MGLNGSVYAKLELFGLRNQFIIHPFLCKAHSAETMLRLVSNPEEESHKNGGGNDGRDPAGELVLSLNT